MTSGSLDPISARPAGNESQSPDLNEGALASPGNAIGTGGPAADARLPPFVICAGEPGSGSTWLFNVIAEILHLHSPNIPIIRRYLDETTPEEGFADQYGTFVIKTHNPPPWVFSFATLARVPIFLSVRDPRDAAASLMTRFQENFEFVLETIRSSGRALAPLSGKPNVVLLRYEDCFTQRVETIDLVCSHLGARLSEADRDDIFERHRPEAVNETIAALASNGVFKDLPARQTWDEETQWHPSHVGDGRIGKWRDVLSEAQAASVNYASRDFRARFGYDSAPPAVASGTTINFSAFGSGADYLNDGFSEPEAQCVWTTGEGATLRIGLKRPASGSLHVSIKCSLGPALMTDLPGSTLLVLINDREIADFVASSSNAGHMLISAWLDNGSTVSEVIIEFRHSGMLSPSELGLSIDTRQLGIALSSVHLEYA
jgi:hypothetical protein